MQHSRAPAREPAGVAPADDFAADWAVFDNDSPQKPAPASSATANGVAPTDPTPPEPRTPAGTSGDLFPAPAASGDFTVTDAALPALRSPSGPGSAPAEPESAIMGFDTLDQVQSYAMGALTVVLLREHSGDLNGLAFARAQVSNILAALRMSEGQQVALFELSPSAKDRETVINQCVDLVGDEATRFRAVQALLALSVAGGAYDARSRAFLGSVAYVFDVSWEKVAAVELAIAMELCARAEAEVPDSFVSEEKTAPRTVAEIRAERRRKKQKMKRAMKVSGITLVGGILFGVTGGIIAPALLTALAGVGVAGAAGLAATGTAASGAVVGSLFGVAGVGVTQGKARKRTMSRLTEFDFERPGDPRVMQEEERRERRAARKLAKVQKEEQEELEKERELATQNFNGLFITENGEPSRTNGNPKRKERRNDGNHANGVRDSGKLIDDIPSPTVRSQPKTEPKEPNVASEETSEPFDEFGLEPLHVLNESKTEVKAQNSIDEFTMMPSGDPMGTFPQKIDFESANTVDHLGLATAPAPTPAPAREKSEAQEDMPLTVDDSILTSDEDASDSDSDSKSSKGKKKRKKKRKSKKKPKIIVGSQGLEAAGHIPSLHICLCVPAWLTERSYGASLRQFEDALKVELPCSQHIALRWESKRLYEMGIAFAKFWASKATVSTIQTAYPHAVAAASSVAGAVAFAFALPLTVLSCLDYVDNPWSVLLSLANTAAEDLADVLVGRSYGQRPVTLFGYSIGARVIFKALESLASRGAHGIVDNVFLLSAPVNADPERWKKIQPVVAGRIVNGYGTMDWALAFFHRGCGHGVYVSGLRAVELEGVENLNLSYIGMEGHKELKDCIPRAMRSMGLGKGYISLPPAKLSHYGVHARGSGIHDYADDGTGAGVSSPVVRNKLEHPSPKMSGPRPGMEDDEFWMSAGIRIDDMPSRRAAEKQEEKEEKELERQVLEESGQNEKKEKKKPKGWWGALSSLKGKGFKLPSATKKETANGTANGAANTEPGEKDSEDATVDDVVSEVTPAEVDLDSYFELSEDSNPVTPVNATKVQSPLQIPTVDSAAIEQESNRAPATIWDDDSVERDHDDDTASNPTGDADDVSSETTGTDVSPDGLTFDWDLQRRIWEEQERQLEERGYADASANIDLATHVVLGIGVEIAGCRIYPFIAQDSAIPVKPVTEWFTNCCIDQRGMTVRVFEFERKRKHLPLNPIRTERKYPKLLGEKELTWKERRSRGTARFCISVEVEEGGSVVVHAKEKLADGSIGEELRIDVARSELCTMRERREMEAKEKAKAFAKDKGVLALPAPHQKKTLALPAPEVVP